MAELLNYHDFEKEVYNWLIDKHNRDTNFTFSLRKKATEGAELDYFIGTEESNYFGTTFWYVPVSFPGSSTDLINLIFSPRDIGYCYYFQFNQTKNPKDKQNEYDLMLIRNLKSKIKPMFESYRDYDENEDRHKMEYFSFGKYKSGYNDLERLFISVEEDMKILFSLVESEITDIKLKYPDFIAHKITPSEFIEINSRFNKRIKKYSHLIDLENPNYWLFQADLSQYDLIEALKDDYLKCWAVNQHKKEIRKGDKVILWASGNKAGIYAIATVTSEVQIVKLEDIEEKYYKDKTKFSSEHEGVYLDLEINMIDSPILKSEVLTNNALKNLKQGNQGTNFSVSKVEFDEILAIASKLNNASIFEFFNKYNKQELDTYINTIRLIIKKFNLIKYDNRIVFTIFQNRINFTIGQRYALNIYKNNHPDKRFGILSQNSININSTLFNGSTKHYYTYTENLNFSDSEWENIYTGFKIELDRTSKSSFYQYNNEQLMNYIFNDVTTMKSGIALNQILYGPPGTGKTYNSINKAIEIINPSFDLSQNREVVKKEFDRLVAEGQIMFTTFHQSMSYEDFVEGIKPISPKNNTQTLIYDIEPGIFRKICDFAEGGHELSFDIAYQSFIEEVSAKGFLQLETPFDRRKFKIKINSMDNCSVSPLTERASEMTITKKTIEKYLYNPDERDWRSYASPIFNYIKANFTLPENVQNKNYVLIIDEINRGNISQIFGELITLIEEDKRIGKTEELRATLPYSKKKFGVPANLFIIGTMNTADRSVEALDTALRRRFSFEEIVTDYTLKGLKYKFNEIEIPKLLETINNRIEILLDKDHQIGHSYFLLKEGEIAIDKLISVFYKNLIPLLQEYFFGDYAKIGLVLGKGFVKKKELEKGEIQFANFDSDQGNEYSDKEVYEIIDYRDKKNEYKIDDIEMNFEKAINFLMNISVVK